MPYNLKFYKTETATARCLAGAGPQTSYTAETQSIIAQRDVDRKALGWAKAAALSMLRCVVPVPGPELLVTPVENYTTEGDKGGLYPTKAYVLTNVGADDLNWAASAGAGWLTLSQGSGFLYVGESVTVVIGVDDTALAAGATYNTTLDFVNTTNNVGDASFLAQATVFPVPQVAASYVSQLGNATLVGHSEFTSPSSPPKKYLVKTLSGEIQWCNYGNGGACPNSLAGSNSQWGRKYEGAETYNANTGVMTTTTKQYLDNGSTYACGPQINYALNIGFNPSTAVETATSGTAFNRVTTPTSRYQTSDFTCVPGGILTFPHPERMSIVTSRDDLTNEDTEDAAIARAAKTPGTSPQAYRELRGAGDFTLAFREVTYTLDFTDLQPGQDYQATIELNTENYGGGGSVITQRTYNFTAVNATHQIVDTLSAADGKQVTAQNPAVVRVP